jgi:hypothetical protein
VTPVKNSKHINFVLPPWGSQTLYLLHDALLSVKLRVVQKNGDALPNNSTAAPINNIMVSAFQVTPFLFIPLLNNQQNHILGL